MFIHGLIVCVLPTLLAAQERAVLPRGHVFFATDFERSDALKGWVGPGVLGPGFQGGHALVLERPAEKGSGYATATVKLPVHQMRGYVVQFSARIKAQNVSHKPQPWNGVKFMAPITTGQEKTWPAAEMGVGTFDWQRVAFRAVVPEDAKQISLVVGLEAVTGRPGSTTSASSPGNRRQAVNRVRRPARSTRDTTCLDCAGPWSAPTSTKRGSACLARSGTPTSSAGNSSASKQVQGALGPYGL